MQMGEQRRRFLRYLGGVTGVFAGQRALAQEAAAHEHAFFTIPNYVRARNNRTLRQSSYDRSGGNRDFWPLPAGHTMDVLQTDGPGIVTHVWFTIASKSPNHLKELVLRVYWDGNSKPSVETPVGDFFGLNLGNYFVYQSAFLNCSSVKAMNSYFAMPFRRSARMTVTNEGQTQVDALYSNIDYELVPGLPEDVMYFHAQYRQATPNHAASFARGQQKLNLDGRANYVFCEARGRGHLMGVTLGVVQNSDAWFGEGDDMTFIDGEAKPSINGSGTEDYFCGAWDFGGRTGATEFAHLYNGAPFIALAEVTGGRYCLYRWHADNPIAFQKSMKHTIEHGHANDRSDSFYSVAYWYQTEPFTDFPELPAASERVPNVRTV
ncbi:MAG: DUF2961 domain-containing protein [Acidobacteriaceae bacterium]|nr:DUF2961 domain-containing protein [Acidobacteriaceae bacterium]